MKQTMKRITAVLVAVCLCMLSVVSVFAQQDGPDVKAEAYCVINRKDGSIVYSKNMDDRYYPASITKIMTALVTLEHCTDLDDTVVFNSEVMDSISSNSSTLNPVAILDEEMTVRDALFGLMLNSANECASALAVYTAGSIDAFVEMMNEKAQELGAVNTHYMNAHGLDDDDHYTTAHDMAIIFDAALKNDVFRYVDSTAAYTIPATNKYGERNCTSTNQLINGARPYRAPLLRCPFPRAHRFLTSTKHRLPTGRRCFFYRRFFTFSSPRRLPAWRGSAPRPGCRARAALPRASSRRRSRRTCCTGARPSLGSWGRSSARRNPPRSCAASPDFRASGTGGAYCR